MEPEVKVQASGHESLEMGNIFVPTLIHIMLEVDITDENKAPIEFIGLWDIILTKCGRILQPRDSTLLPRITESLEDVQGILVGENPVGIVQDHDIAWETITVAQLEQFDTRQSACHGLEPSPWSILQDVQDIVGLAYTWGA